MYDLYHNFPTDFISSLQWVKASESTNLHTKFLLQIQKQWEDPAMLLASNKQQHKQITENRIDKTHRKGQQVRKKTKWAYKKLPAYKTLYRIIWNIPNPEILKRKLSLISQWKVIVRSPVACVLCAHPACSQCVILQVPLMTWVS